MPLVMPDSFDIVRLLVLVGTWLIIPVHLWTYYRVMDRLRAWREAEDARVAIWKADLDKAAALLEECSHLRIQAEIALAQARQQVFNAGFRAPE